MALFGRKKTSVGLDIGSGFVKMVQVDHGGAQPEVTRVAMRPLLPTHACFNFFPIIWLNNPNDEWNFSGGEGQGILLVEGDLRVTGDFQFYGPIYIKGHIETAGGGGVQHFHGGMIAANADLDQNSVLGTADIVYSSCAIERAVLNNAALSRAVPLGQRSWVDLSSVIY